MQMDLFENWGTGLRRIREACAEVLGCREPEFREFDSMFRVNIFRAKPEALETRRDGDGDSLSHGKGISVPLEVFHRLSDNEKAAVKIAAEDGKVTTSTFVGKSGVARRTAVRTLGGLVEKGILEWHGRSKRDPLLQYYVISPKL